MRRVLTTLIVDDQPAFRSAAGAVLALVSPGNGSMLDSDWEVTVVAEAENQQSALAAVASFPTLDVAIVDVHLGQEDGIDLCRQLRALRPELAAILVSTTAPEDLPMDAYTCGAVGFISKSRFTPEALVEVLDAIADLR